MQRVAKKSAGKLPTDFDSLVRLLPPRAISDEVDYEHMQEMIDALTSIPKPSNAQMDYLQTLTILFSDYESRVHAIDTSDLSALDMLKHFMEQHEMNASDLGRLLGERSLGPKILSGDRGLSKTHIRKLADYFAVPADLFL
jgi:HTH-type transcriptional regulator/antitoxin HigA